MTSRTLRVLTEATGTSLPDAIQVAARYPFRLSGFLTRRVQEGSYSDPALRQFLPELRELAEVDGFTPDPTGEASLRPERAVLRTYGNRLALLLTYQCLAYCRFCFRKESVGHAAGEPTDADLERALAYVADHPEIEDVLLSGGDPLALPDHRLLPFLRALTAIPHVRAIRIDSRALNLHPARIGGELLDLIAADGRFWYYAHLNHPDDLDHPDVLAAVGRLLSARVPVLNQCVFLAGVNDDVETMTRLMRLCYFAKVLPYNLYVLDRVRGGGHFQVPDERVVEIYRAVSELSGPAQPLLVYVDANSRKHRAVHSGSMDLASFLASRASA